MSTYQLVPTWANPGVGAEGPAQWYGPDLPDGDANYWMLVPLGSDYAYRPDNTTLPRVYRKLDDADRDDDWVMTTAGFGIIQQRVSYADFTDGGGAAGTLALTVQIPVGAWVLRTLLLNVTGFTGDTSAALTVGDGTDVDRYNAGTPSVFTTATAIDMGAPSGTQIHTTAKTVTLTVTSGADFTAVTAGAMTVRIYYLL